jgi:hypothetical protein
MRSNSPSMNVIDNPVYEKGSLNGLDNGKIEEQQLIGIGNNFDPMKNFAREFANGCGIHSMKIMNSILLLLVAISLTVATNYELRLYWSGYRLYGWEFVQHPLYWLLFIMATISLAIYWFNRKAPENSKTWISCFAVMDICCSMFFIVILFLALLYFSVRSVTLYQYFYPRLTNETMTLAQLTEWKDTRASEYDSYRYGGYRPWEIRPTTTPSGFESTTFSPYMLDQMVRREREILARMILDPTVATLSLLALLLNIVYCIGVKRTIKRTQMWACNYQELDPECSKLVGAYACFFPVGLLKFLQWFIPGIPTLAMLMDAVVRSRGAENMVGFAICFGISISQWLFYLRKFRFRSLEGSNKTNGHGIIKADFVFSGIGLIIYICLYNSDRYFNGISLFALIGMGLHICSVLYLASLIYRFGEGFCKNSAGCTSLSLPRISINVSINVTKNGKSDTVEKDVEKAKVQKFGDEKKSADNEPADLVNV